MLTIASGIAEKVARIFEENFEGPAALFRSPGRVNLIGEHTDYNDGFVLPAAIDKSAYVAMSPSKNGRCRWISIDLKESIEIDFSNFRPTQHRWADYILGIVEQFYKLGLKVPPFNCVVAGDVPIGSGMSSSAALEGAVAFGIDRLNGYEMDRMRLARLAQKSENEFIGVKCGIMDMFASLHGKKDCALRLDCRSLEYEYVPLELGDYRIVLFDTNVKHSLADSEYNVRRAQCEEGASFLRKTYGSQIRALRDVSIAMMQANRSRINPVVYARCLYVVEEIARTLQACEDLKKGDLAAFGMKMYATHEGLRYQYEVSCHELDFLTDAVRKESGVLGARMMGGGFGGCTINLIHADAIDGIYGRLSAQYEAEIGKELSLYSVITDSGTMEL
jgi:galactokinase